MFVIELEDESQSPTVGFRQTFANDINYEA